MKDADATNWDPVRDHAVSAVMTASGEYGGYLRRWDTSPAEAERFWSRGGLERTALAYDPLNYCDRHGRWQLSFATALVACEAFARAEPELLDVYLRGWENKFKAKASSPAATGTKCSASGHRHTH